MRRMREMIAEGRELLDEMAQAVRQKLPKKQFVFPGERAWPIHDRKHALIALQYIQAKRGNPKDWPKVKAAVKKKWGKDPKVAAKLKSM